MSSTLQWENLLYADQAKAARKALAEHMASLVNNEEWADVEFVLDADEDKRIYAYDGWHKYDIYSRRLNLIRSLFPCTVTVSFCPLGAQSWQQRFLKLLPLK